MVQARQFSPSSARLVSSKGAGMGCDGRTANGNKAVGSVCVGGGFAFSKRGAVLAAVAAQGRVTMGQEKQDMMLSATRRSRCELLLTYPVPPVASIVALTLRHEVIHHCGASLYRCLLEGMGDVEVPGGRPVGSDTTSTSPKPLSKKQAPASPWPRLRTRCPLCQ